MANRRLIITGMRIMRIGRPGGGFFNQMELDAGGLHFSCDLADERDERLFASMAEAAGIEIFDARKHWEVNDGSCQQETA